MPRPRLRPHELVPIRKGNKAVVNYGGRSGVYLGPWDEVEDRPSAAATARLRELVALWTADPAAGGRADRGQPLATLWRLWRESPEAAGRYAEQAARAGGGAGVPRAPGGRGDGAVRGAGSGSGGAGGEGVGVIYRDDLPRALLRGRNRRRPSITPIITPTICSGSLTSSSTGISSSLPNEYSFPSR